MPVCEWYLLCDREADGYVDHPILGEVPTCTRCAAKHDLTLIKDNQQKGN